MQLSHGQRARNSSKPTNQSWSNQLLLIILGSCDQGFDLKSEVVQTLRGQTVKTGIQLQIVIIFWHFLMRAGLQPAPLPVWHDQCKCAQYKTSTSNDSEMKVWTKSECCFCLISVARKATRTPPVNNEFDVKEFRTGHGR